MLVWSTAANALLHTATESASAFSMSAFVILWAAQPSFSLPVSMRVVGGVTPAVAEHAKLLSSTMCAKSRAKVRTSGVGCHVNFSAGTIAAVRAMKFAMLVYMPSTSADVDTGG